MKEEKLFHAGTALVGLTTLATCLFHNLRLFENKPLLIFDSSHYLLTANHIHKALLAVFCGNFAEALNKLIKKPKLSFRLPGRKLPNTA